MTWQSQLSLKRLSLPLRCARRLRTAAAWRGVREGLCEVAASADGIPFGHDINARRGPKKRAQLLRDTCTPFGVGLLGRVSLLENDEVE